MTRLEWSPADFATASDGAVYSIQRSHIHNESPLYWADWHPARPTIHGVQPNDWRSTDGEEYTEKRRAKAAAERHNRERLK